MIPLFAVYQRTLWGGNSIAKHFSRPVTGKIGESWEVSVHPDGITQTKDGSLADYLAVHPHAVDPEGSPLPVLIKYIDAEQNLSVQVHPDDAYARLHGYERGKTEMWYILAAKEGAGIYLGFCRDTDADEVAAKVRDGTILELLQFVPVKVGDCFRIDAGTVHAIGAGCLLCEVQESSNVTYRIYDYGRLDANGKPRPLQLSDAQNVLSYRAYRDDTGRGAPMAVAGGSLRLLTQCRYFRCRRLDLCGEYREENRRSFLAVQILSGSGTLDGTPFSAGDSFFVPCGEEAVFVGEGEILLTERGV